MKKYQIGLTALTLGLAASFCGCSKDKPIDLQLSYDGRHIEGKINDVHIEYWDHIDTIWMQLYHNNKSIEIVDGLAVAGKPDGNINKITLSGHSYAKVYYWDNGNPWYVTEGISKEEAKKLLNWGNGILEKVHGIAKEEFGDKLKIPYKGYKPKKIVPLDDYLKDFEF